MVLKTKRDICNEKKKVITYICNIYIIVIIFFNDRVLALDNELVESSRIDDVPVVRNIYV